MEDQEIWRYSLWVKNGSNIYYNATNKNQAFEYNMHRLGFRSFKGTNKIQCETLC